MCVEPQPPIQRFFDVPDLVGNVFERLDPDSRRAFFQSDPQVARAGPVLAQSELRVELSPTKSLEDQWQRVLRLTRSQPLRCLIVAGHSKEQLLGFPRCVPEGRQEEQQKVLQGTKLHLQVVVELDTWSIAHLQSALKSWHEEQQQQQQQQGVEGAAVQLVLDLRGRELVVTTEGDLEPPSSCVLRNGALLLYGTSCVKIAGQVCFQGLMLKGEGRQAVVVDVVGNLEMKDCCVEGGVSFYGGAVRVWGSAASLAAKRCTLCSSGEDAGHGLLVHSSRAALQQCTVSDSQMCGLWVVGKGSSLHAAHCCVTGNTYTGISVREAAHARLERVSSTDNKDGGQGMGLAVSGPGSSMVVTDSSVCKNGSHGVCAGDTASLVLVRCDCSNNENHGFYSYRFANLRAEDSRATGNERGNALVRYGGHISRCSRCDLDGEELQAVV